jgi:hypothetical protein
MKKEKTDYSDPEGLESNNEEEILPGYPVYPESEDIYNVYDEEKEIDPEDHLKKKEPGEKYNMRRNPDRDLDDEFPGDDLDVPGAELDDDMEIIGSEDEENNYYSLGGDDHDDLGEDQEE